MAKSWSRPVFVKTESPPTDKEAETDKHLPKVDPDAAYARLDDPDTSKDTAESIRGERVSSLQLTVLRALSELGGEGTAWGVEQLTGIPHQTITPRFRPLANRRLIYDTGRRKAGGTGRKRIVWGVNSNKEERSDD